MYGMILPHGQQDIVPTSVNATGIVIDHEVELPALYVVSVSNLVVNNKLTLKRSSQLIFWPDAQPAPDLSISVL